MLQLERQTLRKFNQSVRQIYIKNMILFYLFLLRKWLFFGILFLVTQQRGSPHLVNMRKKQKIQRKAKHIQSGRFHVKLG